MSVAFGRLVLFLALPGCLGALPGCGLLFPASPPDFRAYPLRGLEYEEAAALVQDVTARVFAERFGGGFTIDWDPAGRNLLVSPIYESNRRLRMYLHLEPGEGETLVEMLALVEHLDGSSGAIWTSPKQDVHFEEILYEAFLVELLGRPAPEGS